MTDDELAALAAHPPEGHGPWSRAELLAAAEVDELRRIAYILVKTNGGDAKQPQPEPRPGVVSKRRGLNEVGRNYLRKLIASHGATEKPMTTGIPSDEKPGGT